VTDPSNTSGEPWFGAYFPQLRMPYSRIVDQSQAAEALGFHSVWLMDHLAAPGIPTADTLEGWTLLTALATQTTTVRLGHLVLADPFRHPVVLAKMAATLDVISNGRLELGIGWGSVEAELQAFGITNDRPAVRSAKLRETLEILQRMFSGEFFDYDGTYFQLHEAIGKPVPVQHPIPIHIGGGGPKLTMPLVREFAQYWNAPTYAAARFDELLPLKGDARMTMQKVIGLARNDAERDEVVATAQRRFGSWGALVAGTAEEVAAELRADRERGAVGFILQFSDFGTPETLEYFMSAVAPRVTA
jgi:alkanesulfonate monooxygenase SsuD/methylene tetrahydromethanopterin reductase-like flavin-dependent oxidoreductase (luciferase family)